MTSQKLIQRWAEYFLIKIESIFLISELSLLVLNDINPHIPSSREALFKNNVTVATVNPIREGKHHGLLLPPKSSVGGRDLCVCEQVEAQRSAAFCFLNNCQVAFHRWTSCKGGTFQLGSNNTNTAFVFFTMKNKPQLNGD